MSLSISNERTPQGVNIMINPIGMNGTQRYGEELKAQTPNHISHAQLIAEDEDPALYYERIKKEGRIKLNFVDKKMPQILETGEEERSRKENASKLYDKYKKQLHNNVLCRPSILILFNPYDPLLALDFEGYGSTDPDNKPIWTEIDHEEKNEKLNNGIEAAKTSSEKQNLQRRKPKDSEVHAQQFRQVMSRFEEKLTTPALFADWLYVKQPKRKFGEMVLRKCKHIWEEKQPQSIAQSLIALWQQHPAMERVNVLSVILTQWPEGFVIGNIFHALFESTFRVAFKDASDVMRRKYNLNP